MIKSVEGTNTVESAYNGDGLRVSKTVNGQTSNYLYEYDKIILETDGSNAQIAQNVYGNNLINRSVDSDNLYYMYNGHGDVTSLQTMEGTSAAEYYYDAFGTATEVTGEANNPFRYAGYEYDDETDLYYLKSRMYNSVTARFMQEDTYRGQANDPLSLNLYTYCNNNPLIYHDPDGHITTNWDKKKLNRAQQAALSIQTRLYDSKTAKGDTAGAAAAHAAAESIRNTARSSNEVGSASGYTYKVNNNGSSSLNKYDSSALAKATSSGGSTLNGSSYLPEQTIKDTQKINNNSFLPDKNSYIGMTLSKELYGEIPYRDWNVNIDQEWQKNYKKSVENFIKAYKEHQTSGNLAYDEFNFWSMGLPDAWSKMMNAKPFSVEHWVASAELFLYIMPEAKLGSAEAKTLTKELESIVKGGVKTLSKADSKVLRQNLIDAGVEVPNYANAAHHIVAGNSAKAAEARAILQKYGVDINDASNGVFLPTVKDVAEGSYHPSLHTNAYYNEINKQLLKATSKDDVLSILDDISEQLIDRTFIK